MLPGNTVSINFIKVSQNVSIATCESIATSQQIVHACEFLSYNLTQTFRGYEKPASKMDTEILLQKTWDSENVMSKTLKAQYA